MATHPEPRCSPIPSSKAGRQITRRWAPIVAIPTHLGNRQRSEPRRRQIMDSGSKLAIGSPY